MQQRSAKRAQERADREAERATKAENKRLADLKEYKTIMKVGMLCTVIHGARVYESARLRVYDGV